MDRVVRHYRTVNRREKTTNDGREYYFLASFDIVKELTLAAGASGTILSISVPQLQIGVVQGFNNGLDDNTGVGFITWSMLIDGIPVTNFEAITTLYGSGSDMHRIMQDIIVPAGSILSITVSNSSGFSYRPNVGIFGHFGAWKLEQEVP